MTVSRKVFRSTAAALVVLGMVVVGGCSPNATGSTAPSTDAAGVPLPLLIDTDVAPDDLVAIAFLLASPGVDIKAITVSGTGEAHCHEGLDVVLRLLERLDAPTIAVACGRETPMAGDRAFPDAWRADADSGSRLDLSATSRLPFAGDATQLLSETSDDLKALHVLTLGPLTNLAAALERNPGLVTRLGPVTVMGGALHVPGNVMLGGPPDNQVAEWNIYVDPTAAQTVIDSGLRVRLVSLDGTGQVPLTVAYAERVRKEATGPGGLVLIELFDRHPFMTDGTYYLWDPLAAALAAGHSLGSFSRARVHVEEAEGPETGFTRPIDGDPNVEYLSSADAAAAEDTLLETMNRPGRAP